MSTFFRYLLHVEGGCHLEEQALIQTRQVNIILDTADPTGDDLHCLIRNDGLDFWDRFTGPKLANKELTGNTLKVYIRSLELFIIFIEKNLFYRKDLLSADEMEAIIRLNKRLPDYRATVHRRTAHQTTTRKVNESIEKINPEDIRNFEQSALAKTALSFWAKQFTIDLSLKTSSPVSGIIFWSRHCTKTDPVQDLSRMPKFLVLTRQFSGRPKSDGHCL